MKRFAPLALAVPLLLAGCGSSGVDEVETTTVTATPEPEIPDAIDPANGTTLHEVEEAGRLACIDRLDQSNADTQNMPVVAHDPRASFKLSRADGDEHQGTMSWDATIYTKAGIPWEHWSQCIADLSTAPPTVTYLSSKVLSLQDD